MLNTCPSQRQMIKQSIIHNIRIDGRKNNTHRTPIIKTGVIAHLPGSSYVYLQYQNIQIYTGIKIKVEQVAQISQANQVALELSSMRKLKDQQNDQMQRIQNILQLRMIQKLAKSKEISEFLKIADAKKHKLYMYIDVFFLTSPHISQLELIVAGIKAALLSTTISEIDVSFNEVTQEQSTQLTKNTRTFTKQDWEEIFIIGLVSSTDTGEQFVVDMRREEYESMDACFLVDVIQNKVTHLQSIKGSTTIDSINKCARFAQTCSTQKNKF